MNCQKKTDLLKEKIKDSLSPLIGKKCVLIGLPYYLNIGDILIWEGTRDFLQEHAIDVLLTASKETFQFPALPHDVTILLSGGGNFGDLWTAENAFRNKVIQHYPQHPIIIFPQTIYYQNEENLVQDALLYRQHPNLTICARDNASFNILQEHFSSNKSLLLPDMAFCISPQTLNNFRVAEKGKALFVKRGDIELKDLHYEVSIHTSLLLEVHDWPSIEKGTRLPLLWIEKRLRKKRKWIGRWYDRYMDAIFRPYLVKLGVRFVSQYDEVYTTRLHVAILSILLGKPITFFDNSYGKNSSFYDTWLSDVEGISFVR